jgi:hypothetical protein
LAVAGGSLLAGCGRSIQVTGVGDVLKQHVRVDIVGVSWAEKQQWEAVSMQDYWSEGNQRRKDSISQGYNLPFTFRPNDPCKITIKDNDPLWQNWEGRKATHFLVLFDTCSDSQGWRLCLPLSKKCWKGSARKRIEIVIQPSGIVPRAAPKDNCKG